MTESVIKLDKYEVRHTNGANLVALRHGEPWRNLAGDGLILAMAQRIEQLESLFTQPTPDMVNAGLGEVQRIAEGWDEAWDFDLSEVSDDQASDMAVFVLQAMASKLPKAGE